MYSTLMTTPSTADSLSMKLFQTVSSRAPALRTVATLSSLLLVGLLATTATQAAPKNRKSYAHNSTQTAPIAQPPVAEATPEQLEAGNKVFVGEYDCEMGKHITVNRSETQPGYFNLKLTNQSWLMKPVLSSTGAIRLEDVSHNTLLIQVASKSMLMDTKNGTRMIDGCIHEAQRTAQNQVPVAPQP